MAKNKRSIDNNRYIISSVNPQSPIAEQYRTIRTTIDFKMADQGIKSFLVASSEVAAGKSTVSANLAVAFAQQGKKVLLIDGDLRKPTVNITFKVQNRVGLTNILMHQSSIEDAIQGTRLSENLTIITSGPIPPNPSELLASSAMKNLIDSVSDFFDVVLIDNPPISAVNDAQILSSYVGGVVIVVSAYETTKQSLEKTKKMLEQVNTNISGVVLHGVNSSESPSY